MNQELLFKLLGLIDFAVEYIDNHEKDTYTGKGKSPEQKSAQELRETAAELRRRYSQEEPRCYKVVRRFFKNGRKITIKRNLTLIEAQDHCKDPQTSSSTCTNAVGKRRLREHGHWQDGYERE